MAQDDSVDKQQKNDWIRANVGESYTQAFDIRKVMYRIQNFDLPFKRGVRVEQFLMFFATLALCFIFYFVILSPVFSIIGFSLPWTFILAYFLIPPIMLSIRIGKPMPHGKSIFGSLTSWLRFKLDDEWHRRGMPMKKAPNTKAQGNYLRTWTVDPRYSGIEEAQDLPATEFLEYSRIELPDQRQVILTLEELKQEEERLAAKKFLEKDDDFYDRLYGMGSIGAVNEEDLLKDDYESDDLEEDNDVRVDDEYIAQILARK